MANKHFYIFYIKTNYMSQNKNFLDELNKMAGSAFSSALQAKDGMIDFIKEHMEAFWKSKDAVSRDEFEALKARVDKLQSKNDSVQHKKKSS